MSIRIAQVVMFLCLFAQISLANTDKIVQASAQIRGLTKELKTSEDKYRGDLIKFIAVLNNHLSDPLNPLESKGFFDKLKGLFKSSPSVSLNEEMIAYKLILNTSSDLQKAINQLSGLGENIVNAPASDVRNALTTIVDYFLTDGSFLNPYLAAIKKQNSFANLRINLTEQELKNGISAAMVDGWRITPTQRGPRYALFFNDIVKNLQTIADNLPGGNTTVTTALSLSKTIAAAIKEKLSLLNSKLGRD